MSLEKSLETDPTNKETTRMMTFRMEVGAHDVLKMLSLVTEISASEHIRRAIDQYIELQLADPAIKQACELIIQRFNDYFSPTDS